MKKKIVLLAALLCIVGVLAVLVYNSKKQPPLYSDTKILMDTLVSQKIYADEEISGKIAGEVFKILEKKDLMFSAYNKNSEIYKINNSQTEVVEVSNETAGLVLKAKELSKKSDGVFDLSVYPVSNLWNNALKTETIPTDDEIKNALKYVNFENVLVDSLSSTVCIDKNMGIDLGAIAKGEALNEVVEFYKQNDISSAICSIGSSAVAVVGEKPNGEDYVIGLRDPISINGNDVFSTLELKDTIISTSGGYERYAELNGQKYHHIIDIKTGYPSNSDILSASVVNDDGGFADYMSTYLYLLGYDKAKEYIEQNSLDAVIVKNDKTVYVSKGLNDKFKITNNSFIKEK